MNENINIEPTDDGVQDPIQDDDVSRVDYEPTHQAQEPVQPTSEPQTQPEPTITPTELEIEGVGKVKPEDIKEWKLGYMRQSDYTRKTQEVAKQKQETQDAVTLYNYLRDNPNIATQMQQGDYSGIQKNPTMANMLNPAKKEIEDVQYQLASLQLDNDINRLKSQYSDFDEVAILQEADKRGLTDLEFIYKAMQGDKLPSIREQITKEIRSALTKEIQQNGLATETLISTKDTKPITDSGLTEQEKMIANQMSVSYEEYAKYR